MKGPHFTDTLVKHLFSFIQISETLESRLKEITYEVHVQKGSFLHRPGRICDTTYFIDCGLLRVFYQREDKEITNNFAAEGEWITSIYSFLQNVPDHFYIQALEPSTLLAINIRHLEQCFADFHEMERFGRMLMSKFFLEQSERLVSLQFHSAKERYLYFLSTSKNKINRVPLGMLASHLGMSQETLSRIRAEKTTF